MAFHLLHVFHALFVQERYSLDFSVRADGSTKFGPDQRWGVFPAVSARWNIIDESWMEWSRKWLSMLSIRPSWGRWATNLRRIIFMKASSVPVQLYRHECHEPVEHASYGPSLGDQIHV